MKKLSYIIIGALIGAFATYYFCPRTLEAEKESKIVKPKGVISVEDAIALNNNWTKYRKAAVDSAAQKQGRKVDKRSTKWKLEDIRNYLDYAEAESKYMGYTMDGIKVYLGVYGEDAGPEKSNYTTMFIAPTGGISLSEASVVPFNFSSVVGDPPVPPLNQGSGGGEYP
ncbi:MAG: hypothetical protein ABJK28_13570 [Algibacter sp.]